MIKIWATQGSRAIGPIWTAEDGEEVGRKGGEGKGKASRRREGKGKD